MDVDAVLRPRPKNDAFNILAAGLMENILTILRGGWFRWMCSWKSEASYWSNRDLIEKRNWYLNAAHNLELEHIQND